MLASGENRTLDLQFTRLMHYHCATEARRRLMPALLLRCVFYIVLYKHYKRGKRDI